MACTSISNSYVRSLSVPSGPRSGLEEGVDPNDDVEGDEGEDLVILDERSSSSTLSSSLLAIIILQS